MGTPFPKNGSDFDETKEGLIEGEKRVNKRDLSEVVAEVRLGTFKGAEEALGEPNPNTTPRILEKLDESEGKGRFSSESLNFASKNLHEIKKLLESKIKKLDLSEDQEKFLKYLLSKPGSKNIKFKDFCLEQSNNYIDEIIDSYIQDGKFNFEKYKKDILSYRVGENKKLSFKGIALLQILQNDSEVRFNFHIDEIEAISKNYKIRLSKYEPEEINQILNIERMNMVNRFISTVEHALRIKK